MPAIVFGSRYKMQMALDGLFYWRQWGLMLLEERLQLPLDGGRLEAVDVV